MAQSKNCDEMHVAWEANLMGHCEPVAMNQIRLVG